MEQRYRMPEAAERLGVSVSLLRAWVQKAGLRQQVEQQRLDYDMRVFYLTQAQLEQLAGLHGRQIVTQDQMDIETLEAKLSAEIAGLKADIRDMKQRMDKLETHTHELREEQP